MQTGRRCLVPPAAVALLALVAGCGSEDGSHSYPTSETRISAHVGEQFTLAADELPGEKWSLVTPKPDASVLRSTGDHYGSDDDSTKVPGAKRRHVFTFKATGAGSTDIILLHCPVTACTGGPQSPTPSPPPSSSSSSPAVSQPAPKRITYTVSVS